MTQLPSDFETTRIISRRVAKDDYVPRVDVPTVPTDEAPFKNELVVNAFSTPSGVDSAAGVYLRVGTESFETVDDHIIRLGKVIVTTDSPGTEAPNVAYRGTSSGSEVLETGELWYRTSDKAFFVHDGTRYVKVTPSAADEITPGIIRVGTEQEVLSTAIEPSVVTPMTLEKWRDDRELVSRLRNNYTVYVNQACGDDSITNDGLDPHLPFLTLERALLEVAIKSYNPGSDNDRYANTTVAVAPGDYTLDNRPGVADTALLYSHSAADVGGINQFETGAFVTDYIAEQSILVVTSDLRNVLRKDRQIYNEHGASAIVTAVGDSSITVRLIRGQWAPQDRIYYSNYAAYNVPDGGIVVPRGCSIIGSDLRKCILRAEYIGDLEKWKAEPNECECSTDGLTSRLLLTGGSYICNLTFADNLNLEESHHLLTAAALASFQELTNTTYGYYRKVARSLGKRLIPALVEDEFEANPAEYTIVSEIDEAYRINARGFNSINTVSASSPYISNCSLLSRFGARGLRVDGAKVSGFKSVLVDRFTNVSLQEDTLAFIEKEKAPGNKVYRDNWKHASFEALNDGYAQLVNCFTVCSAHHFRVESGGELSLSGCSTSFGDTALSAAGFSRNILDLDSGGLISRIIPPVSVATESQAHLIGRVSTYTNATQLYAEGEIDMSLLNLVADDYLFATLTDGTTEVSCKVADPTVRQDINGYYISIQEDENNFLSNLPALEGRFFYTKRTPDPRAPEDKLYWLEVTNLIHPTQRSPQTNYILRLSKEQYLGAQPTETLVVAKTRKVNSDGTALPQNTQHIALKIATPLGKSTYELLPTTATREALKIYLESVGLEAENIDPLLQPGPSAVSIIKGTELITSQIEFAKPSTIRAFGTSFEWVGYGNYSSALPALQNANIDKGQQLDKIIQETNGGKIYNVGMTQEGELLTTSNTEAGLTQTETAPDILEAFKQEVQDFIRTQIEQSGEGGSVPAGVIVMWSGSAVPQGWLLCDGTQSTPDLTNQFGANGSYVYIMRVS